jgi:hypothetical protein
MKIRLVGAELSHAEGRTDMKKVTVAFRNFANVPNGNHQWHAFRRDEAEVTFCGSFS